MDDKEYVKYADVYGEEPIVPLPEPPSAENMFRRQIVRRRTAVLKSVNETLNKIWGDDELPPNQNFVSLDVEFPSRMYEEYARILSEVLGFKVNPSSVKYSTKEVSTHVIIAWE